MLRPNGQQRIWEHTIFGQDQGTLNQILQFTDVAGPVVRAEVQHCFLRNMVDLPAHPPAKKLDKVRYEGRYILAALSQWRQLDRKDIQAKVEVTAKFAISHHPRQIAMGRSYKPHIYLVSPAASQAFEFLFLQYAEKFWLQRRRNIADFVKEQGTFIGQLEAAKLLRDGSRERALFVAKELTLQQVQWDGCAVQLDEWTSAPWTDIVDRTCDQLLASAGFALN
jgi:hypothetical protein